MKLFFVRNHADLDFFLPLLSELENCSLIIYEHFPISENCKNILLKNKISYRFIFNGILYKYIFLLFKLNKNMNINLNFLTQNLYKRLIKSELNKIILQIPKKEKILFFFDHTDSELVRSMISFFKSNIKNNKEFISLPHGINIFENYINESNLLKIPKKSDLTIFDKVICSDEFHFNTLDCKNKKILFPLRYTKSWQKKILDTNYKFLKKNSRKNILIIHSKFSGNVHKLEFYRVLNIILATDKFNVFVKLHPRITKSERNDIYENSKNMTFLNHDLLNMTYAADAIVFFQSSSIYDAILLKKLIIYPKFASSNVIDKNILSYCNVAESPDDLVNIFNKSFFDSSRLNNRSDIIYFDYRKLLKLWKNELC